MVPSSLFILAYAVCKSLQCLNSTLTQGGKGAHLFRLTCSVVLWEGRKNAKKKKKITGVCGECLQCMDHTGFAPAHGMCVFLVYTAQAPGCSAGELSKVGPGFCALPSSKLFKCGFSGTPQRHRLNWACIFFPSQVRAAQVTRWLESAVSQVGGAS